MNLLLWQRILVHLLKHNRSRISSITYGLESHYSGVHKTINKLITYGLVKNDDNVIELEAQGASLARLLSRIKRKDEEA